MLSKKALKVISLDLPTSHIALSPQVTDEFTSSMIKAINSMMMDMLAAIARKDYQDRRRRQAEGDKKRPKRKGNIVADNQTSSSTKNLSVASHQ